jgi:hypothetical protein
MKRDPFTAITEVLVAPARRKRKRESSIKPGDRYGQWTVQKFIPSYMKDGKQVPQRCRCKCACGKVRDVLATSLQTGKSKSCGHATFGRPPK